MISAGIDKATVAGRQDTVQKLTKEYEEMIELIDKFLEFRRTHKDCLLEGDPGYGPI